MRFYTANNTQEVNQTALDVARAGLFKTVTAQITLGVDQGRSD